MNSAERLIRYCRIDTQSDAKSGTHPSTAKQFDLANMLVEELWDLGLDDACLDDHCYIYGHLPSNLDHPVKTVGFLAHMDTAGNFSGTGVSPRVIENFDGTDIELGHGRITRMDDFPYMKTLKGKTLIVTDGSTLLGADDKAGITCIMEALAWLKEHPEFPHGRIAVAFTPDEEIGEGAMFFDVEKMGADFAYTMDGDTVSVYSDETFSAVSAEVKVHGNVIHPGEGKNRMKNAALAGAEFANLLPGWLTPAHTEGKEGFIHLTSIKGDCGEAVLEYILRDHDHAKIDTYCSIMEAAAQTLNAVYGEGTVEVRFVESYRNMKEALIDHPELTRIAAQAIRDCGYDPVNVPIRGGSDGSHISFMGLPCPNLGNGGGNFHGPYEYCLVEELEDAAKIIRRIIELTAEEEAR